MARFTHIPSAHKFNSEILGADANEEILKLCYDENGIAGPLFESKVEVFSDDGFGFSEITDAVGAGQDVFINDVVKSFSDDGNPRYNWQQMVGPPDTQSDPDTFEITRGGTTVMNLAHFAVRTPCSHMDLNIHVNGLIETTNAGFDRLQVNFNNSFLSFDEIRHENQNSGCDDPVKTDNGLTNIQSLHWQGECSQFGSADQGDIVTASQDFSISQQVCPTIITFRTDTIDERNHMGARIFYDLTLTVL